MAERISPRRFHQHGWRILRDDACTYFATGSFAKGVELVEAIGELAAAGDRYPDIDLRPEGVTVRLGTHGPLPTEADLALAERISAAAREVGVSIDLEGLQAVQVAIDALVIPEVLQFWQAVLGYRKVDDADLIDPRLAGPPFWFQQMDAPRPQQPDPHRRLRLAGRGRGARRGGNRGQRPPRQRGARARVVDPRRRRGQRGRHRALARPGIGGR